MSIVAQPVATITQSMNNMGNQFAQAPYGQAFLIPSNAAMFNSTEGQVSARTMTSPSTKPEVIQTSDSITHQSSALPLNSPPNVSTPKMEPLQPECTEA